VGVLASVGVQVRKRGDQLTGPVTVFAKWSPGLVRVRQRDIPDDRVGRFVGKFPDDKGPPSPAIEQRESPLVPTLALVTPSRNP
jgi:hypothetical protein